MSFTNMLKKNQTGLFIMILLINVIYIYIYIYILFFIFFFFPEDWILQSLLNLIAPTLRKLVILFLVC